ncbi:scarecrow-like protein 14 [Abrus precatorius]|uniref:Scarecrow-like protein 14 n=1 Tax=Abrus precatorius TaxID=3816 RepID=A0A8B8KS84_ABRPR|nr:scarecrow-like protein 14 [Abrus precatorius]
MDANFPEASDIYHFGEDGSILASDPSQYPTDWYVSESLAFATTDPSSVAGTDPSLEDNDFSETAKFIGQILMEENVEQRPFYDSLSLQVTEKSFYDALTDNASLSPNQHPLVLSPEGGTSSSSSNSNSNSNNSGNNFSYENSHLLKPPSPDSPVSIPVFQFNSHVVSQSPPPSLSVNDGLLHLDSSITKLLAQNIFSDVDSVSQFKRGLEEASKFLPPGPKLVTGLEPKGGSSDVVEDSIGLRSRKNHEREESDFRQEGRSSKHSALSVEDESDLSDAFDRLFVNVGNVCTENYYLQRETVNAEQRGEKGEGGKGRPKKQGGKKETVDLRNLLLMCAQAVYANDNRTANELLNQIRRHALPNGDASQRLAYYFAKGLEARLVGDGTGAQGMFSSLSSKRITVAELLKAHQTFLSACSFKKFTYFFANKMIMKTAAKEETLHIIDFGILYGFQWPILIKFLSDREGGPPKLRITGIEFPQPGFRPSEMIEETGRRLANYCQRYNVPFQYHPLASRNWETIQVEDLKIESNEVVAVNCLMRFENLLDETIEVNSPRNAVLHLIRKINPAIFTHSIVNGSYNAPFFATRFREALFHFSTIYDMCDTVIPRGNEMRMMIEREILGREAMNVIACEGSQRVERPETYKQWQVRNTRAGFKQLPLNEELMAKFRTKLKEWYHKDFVFDQDQNWMLQGWKGRILYASTCWVPA